MEFVWVCFYHLTYLAAGSVPLPQRAERIVLSAAMAVYLSILLIWLFRSGRAQRIRICRIRRNRKHTAAAALALLLFPVCNILTSAYLETDLLTVLLIFSTCAVEEIFFRGFLLQYLKRYGITCAVILSSIIFALYHLSSSAAWDGVSVSLQILSAFAAGMCYAVSLFLLDSILPGILAHFLTNLTAAPTATVAVDWIIWCICIGLSLLFCIIFLQKCKVPCSCRGEANL